MKRDSDCVHAGLGRTPPVADSGSAWVNILLYKSEIPSLCLWKETEVLSGKGYIGKVRPHRTFNIVPEAIFGNHDSY